MKKYLAELVGTYALVFCGTGAIVIGQEIGGTVSLLNVALAFGLILMAMIYALGDVSGAHFNPAVTLALTVVRKLPAKQALPYFASQVVGAVSASFTIRLLFPANPLLGTTLPAGSLGQSFAMETVLTFFLVLVALRMAHCSKELGILAGLAIGAVVLLEVAFAGPVSGASMNPARSLAPALVSGHLNHLWIYLTAPFAGAVLAVLIWKGLSTPDNPSQEDLKPG